MLRIPYHGPKSVSSPELVPNILSHDQLYFLKKNEAPNNVSKSNLHVHPYARVQKCPMFPLHTDMEFREISEFHAADPFLQGALKVDMEGWSITCKRFETRLNVSHVDGLKDWSRLVLVVVQVPGSSC